MAFNGAGTFVIDTSGQPVVTGTTISSTVFNALTADIATGLSTVVCKDGQTTPTANLPMGNYKHTGASNATTAGQYLVYGQNITGASANFTGSANITGSANVSGSASITGNVTGGNLTTAGVVTATGNLSGSNLTLTSGFINGVNTSAAGAMLTGNGTALVGCQLNASAPFVLFNTTANAAAPASAAQVTTALNISSTQRAYLRYTASNGTNGGSTSTGWTHVPLNNVTDADGIVTLTSNNFTLTAGNYTISAQHAAGANGQYMRAGITYAANNTLIANSSIGFSQYASVSDSKVLEVPPFDLTLAANTTLRLQTWMNSGYATYGLGIASGAGQTEVYAQVNVEKRS